jgi:hypothetical protein
MTTRLSAEERRALAILAAAGRKGATQPLLSDRGFDAGTITGLVNKGLATVTPSKVRMVKRLSRLVASGSKRRVGWHLKVDRAQGGVRCYADHEDLPAKS